MTVYLCAYHPVEGDICGGEDVMGGTECLSAGRNGIQGSSEHLGFRKKQSHFTHNSRRKDRAHTRDAGRSMDVKAGE